jgi:transposase-like protein
MSNPTRPQQQQQQRRHYPDELKQEAIRLAIEHGMTCDAISAKLNAPPKTVANWVRPPRCALTSPSCKRKFTAFVRNATF